MTNLFSMSDLGELSYYLGIQVQQCHGQITLCQALYARKLLQQAGMEEYNPCAAPMEARLKLSKNNVGRPVDATLYRSIVGSLRYLVYTRPEISYAVGYVSRFMEKPTTEYYAAVKHLLRYVAGSSNFGILYGKGSGILELKGYSDADLAGDVDDRKSTTGLIYFLEQAPVSWQSQKQRVVAISSCESEYIAAATAACQGIWLSRLLGELQNEPPRVPKLLVDNKSAIFLTRNPAYHDRSKHIDVRYHLIRNYIEQGELEISHINTES